MFVYPSFHSYFTYPSSLPSICLPVLILLISHLLQFALPFSVIHCSLLQYISSLYIICMSYLIIHYKFHSYESPTEQLQFCSLSHQLRTSPSTTLSASSHYYMEPLTVSLILCSSL